MRSHILRYRVRPNGDLAGPDGFGPSSLGPDALVDGFAFDAAGNVWVTTILRNGLGVITTDGAYHVVVEDPRPDVLSAIVHNLAAGTVQPVDVMSAAGDTLRLITSITFGGPDVRTVYLGSLGMNRLLTFRSPIPGLPLTHWE